MKINSRKKMCYATVHYVMPNSKDVHEIAYDADKPLHECLPVGAVVAGFGVWYTLEKHPQKGGVVTISLDDPIGVIG